MKTLGIRHVALNVRDPQKSKAFYTRILKMEVEWEPDADNVYLTTGGQDNLALHRAPGAGQGPAAAPGQALDHIGFVLGSADEVDAWHEWMAGAGVPIVKAMKTHRDGARSFYIKDPDGILIQMIYHPPIASERP